MLYVGLNYLPPCRSFSNMDSPAPDARSSAVRTDRLYLGLAMAMALLAILVRSWIAWRTHYTLDDALISLRYAENLAQGHGFVFNPGERILGTTTPLYT